MADDLTLAHATLRPFEAHGVTFTGTRENQAYGLCPFSGKADKFYVNVENGLWDSKTAGVSGNLHDFLRIVAETYEEAITPELLQKLADNRKLPVEAFKGWGIGWNGIAYTLPVRDLNGHVVDIRTARLGKSFLSTAGCKVGLLGAHLLKKNRADPIYLCEGEWDAIALAWVLKKLKLAGIVLAVPGAGTLKAEWVSWLSGRVVHTLYDNDPAGEEAEMMVQKKLGTSAAKLTYVHWPEDLPRGFDTRDWLVYGAVERNDPDGSWRKLQRLFHPETRRSAAAMKPVPSITIKVKKRLEESSSKPVTIVDVHSAIGRWLLLRDTDTIDVVLATVLSQRLHGDPVWMFIVGPPGSAKTVIISIVSEFERVHITSSITPHTLVSGASGPGGSDPSLVPRLDGKTLVVKDFTVILGMHDKEKEEIFDILRDAYDGKCAKEFGNGISRRYESRFTVLAAVTTVIYDTSASHAALGERFLKFSVGDNVKHYREDEVIARAIDNSMKPTEMTDEVTPVVTQFLEERWEQAVEPELPDELKTRLVNLGKFTARLRGTVSREQYNQDMVKSRPAAEVGTRLGIQLTKLARALAMVYGHTVVGEEEYRVVRKVALDTVTQRTEDFVRTIWKAGRHPGDAVSTVDIATQSKYPTATVTRVLNDLYALDVVDRKKLGPYKYQWTISPYIMETIKAAHLYEDEADFTRVSVREILIARRKPRRTKRIVFVPAKPTPVLPRKPTAGGTAGTVKRMSLVPPSGAGKAPTAKVR